MALTKETQIGKIEVVGKHKFVQVRTDTVVMEDGTELSRQYHRKTLVCGRLDADNNLVDTVLTDEHSEVQSVCNAVWTQSIKDAYRTFLIAQQDN